MLTESLIEYVHWESDDQWTMSTYLLVGSGAKNLITSHRVETAEIYICIYHDDSEQFV